MEQSLKHLAQNSVDADLVFGKALAQQKIEARLQLLEMPPEEAQKIVEQTLYPQLWECRTEDRLWEESLPSHYGETDA